MKIARVPWIAVAVFLLAPSVLRAQEASFDTPDGSVGCPTVRNVPLVTPGGGAKMIVRVWPNGLPKVRADVALEPCNEGYLVALKIMDAIHGDAVGQGYTCSATFGTCGGAVAGGAAPRQDWQFTQPSGDGFSLTKFPGAGTTQVHVASMGNAVLKAINVSTNAGNTCGLDLLPRYLVQVIPSGLNAVVTFRVFHIQGGQNPRTFTINTVLFPDPTLLINAIKAGFDGLGLGLNTRVGLSTLASFPEAFVPGLVVLISNAQMATRFEVQGAPGQLIASETSFPEGVSGLGGGNPEDQARVATRIYAAPNPFASRTGFELAMAKAGNVEAGVFDVAGRQVRSLYSGSMPAGTHRLEWDGWDMNGRRCQSGIYFIRVERGGARLGTKVFLLP